MNGNISIDQNSLKRLNMNFDEFKRELLVVCKEALKNLGARIVAKAQTNLKRGKHTATSFLINSGRTAEHADGSILAGFPTRYAYFVEFGRRAGKWPPFDEILQWVKIKRIATLHNREERKALGVTKLQDYITETYNTAFLIQRSIGKKGTRPHPFLMPAFEENKRTYEAVIRKGARKIMNKDYTR